MKSLYLSLGFVLSVFFPYNLQASTLSNKLSNVLEQQVGVTYQFGGDNPDTGFDCSGLVMYAYNKIGKKLPHSTRELQKMGQKVSLSNLKTGDLIFFSPEKGRVSHVGVYLGYGVVVHAPSTGRNVTVMDVFHHVYWKKVIAFARRIVTNL